MERNRFINKEDREDRYVHFPLCLLQKTYEDPHKALNLILDYGIVNFARTIKIDPDNVARQLMYAYYRKQDTIQPELLNIFGNYIESELITIDEDYYGFSNGGNEFDVSDNIEEIKELIKSDRRFKHNAYQFYRVTQAQQFLGIGGENVSVTMKRYSEGQEYRRNFEAQFGPDCCPSIKVRQLFDFRDSGKDIDLFRASVGIRSLIGQKHYVATTRNVILMRMFGCKTEDALQEFLNHNIEARAEFELFTRTDKALRYHFDKLFKALLQRGLIRSKIFERNVSRKIFISVALDYGELADAIIRFGTRSNHANQEIHARRKIRATI